MSSLRGRCLGAAHRRPTHVGHRRRGACGEDGIGLVELLVVMVLLVVIGGTVVTTVTTGMRTTRVAQERVYGHTELQRAAERVSREIRAADPLVVAQPDRIEAQVQRGGATRTYVARQAGDRLEEGMDGTATPVVRNLTPDAEPMFRFYDRHGAEIPTVTDVTAVAHVTVTLVRDLPEQDVPLRIQAAASLRNAGG